MDQGLALSYWLGIAGFAIGLAHIVLWRTRRVLSQSGKDTPAPEVRLVSAAAAREVRLVPAAAALEVRLVPAAVKKSAGSVIAT